MAPPKSEKEPPFSNVEDYTVMLDYFAYSSVWAVSYKEDPVIFRLLPVIMMLGPPVF